MNDFLVAFMVMMAIAAVTTFAGAERGFATTSPCKIELGPVSLCW